MMPMHARILLALARAPPQPSPRQLYTVVTAPRGAARPMVCPSRAHIQARRVGSACCSERTPSSSSRGRAQHGRGRGPGFRRCAIICTPASRACLHVARSGVSARVVKSYLPHAFTTSAATASISRAFSLVNGRGMSRRVRTALPFTLTSKQPLRGFSALMLTVAPTPLALTSVSSFVALVLNAPAIGPNDRGVNDRGGVAM